MEKLVNLYNYLNDHRKASKRKVLSKVNRERVVSKMLIRFCRTKEHEPLLLCLIKISLKSKSINTS